MLLRTAPAFLAVLLSMAPTAFAAAPALGDPAADRVVASTPVPDAARKVGQTRLVSRGGATVVQTLLSTKLLKRVIAEIRAKEDRNWPAGQPGEDGKRAYLDALDSARQTLDRRTPGPEWADRRQRLLIEFAADVSSSTVLVGTFETLPGDDEPGPLQREAFATLDPPRDYVLRNMRLIVADSFHVDEKDVDRVGSLGPASPAAPAAASAPAPIPAPARTGEASR